MLGLALKLLVLPNKKENSIELPLLSLWYDFCSSQSSAYQHHDHSFFM